MPQEIDLKKLEGEIYPVEVILNAADGAVDTENYEVYGAAEAGRTRHSFAVQTTDKPGVYLVEIPALSFKQNPYWAYQICARRKSTGHEWLLLQGHIVLRYRIADVPDVKIGATQQTFEATISADMLKVEVHEIAGVKGDRGYSAYEVACQNGFEGTETEWLDSLKHDAAQEAIATVKPHATAASNDAAAAQESARQAKESEEAAHTYASEAEDCQSVAHEYMDTAKEHMTTAANSEANAATSEQNAAKSATDAEAALQAAQNAQILAEVAAINALEAQQAAYNAQILAESAAINALQAEIDKSEE